MNSVNPNDYSALMPYLSEPERAEMEALLAAEPEPVEIVFSVIRPDLSVQAHLLREPGGGLRELSTDEIATRGLPAPTPEVNGGYRLCETMP